MFGKAILSNILILRLTVFINYWAFDKFQTKVKSIYAVGDVIGGHCLASISAEQGREAVKKVTLLNSE